MQQMMHSTVLYSIIFFKSTGSEKDHYTIREKGNKKSVFNRPRHFKDISRIR